MKADKITILGYTKGTWPDGNPKYMISISGKLPDKNGNDFTGCECNTYSCTEDIYNIVSKCQVGDVIEGILARDTKDKYRIRISRL